MASKGHTQCIECLRRNETLRYQPSLTRIAAVSEAALPKRSVEESCHLPLVTSSFGQSQIPSGCGPNVT